MNGVSTHVSRERERERERDDDRSRRPWKIGLSAEPRLIQLKSFHYLERRPAGSKELGIFHKTGGGKLALCRTF
jgi:hypothetical protein